MNAGESRHSFVYISRQKWYNNLMQNTTLQTKPLLKSLGIDSDMGGRNFAFLQIFTLYVSDAQMEALEKAVKYGWKATKIVYSRDLSNTTCAIGIAAKGCAAWMTPDGKIDRAEVGKKTAYLDKKWTESV